MAKPSFYTRKFLNKRGNQGLASILGEVEVDNDGDVWIDLNIHDCNRGIQLHFDWDGGQDNKDNNLFKLRTLADVLNKMVAAAEECYEWVEREGVSRDKILKGRSVG